MMKKVMLFAPDVSTRYPNGEKSSPIIPFCLSIERMNPVVLNMNKDNVKEILKILIKIQAYQCVFFRNVFRSNLKKLDRNEMNYLLILSDSLHNFPSFIKSCLMFLEGKDTSMQNWNFFATEVQRLKIAISDAENCNIKLNNTIRGWMFDLTRMNQYVDLLQEKLITSNNEKVALIEEPEQPKLELIKEDYKPFGLIKEIYTEIKNKIKRN